MTRASTVLALVCLATLPRTAAAQAAAAFIHSVPTGQVSPGPLALSLRDAVARGLDHNLAIILEREHLRSTESGRAAAMSALLPRVSASIRQSDHVLSTAAFGFDFPGLPSVIGPFGLFDARVSLSTPLFDARGFGALRRGRAEVRAGQASVEDVREAVILAVGWLYLQAEAEAARVESTRAQVATAEALVQVAADQRTAGIVAGIDVLRQQVQYQSARSRLIAAENALDKAKLALARAIGLPAGQTFTLADVATFVPAPLVALDEAVRSAVSHRPDVRAAQARVEAARAERSAEAAGRLPTLYLDADLGAIGRSPSTSNRTYSVAAVLRVPIFEGGNARARVRFADAELARREAELADLTAGLRYEVEESLLDIKAADASVDVADRARALSRLELEQAQDRFRAGVSSTLELVQAQEAVSAANEQYIARVFAHAVAKASFARAIGQVHGQFMSLMGGTQQ